MSLPKSRFERAALKLMRKLLKKYGFVSDKLVTDDLRCYAAAAHASRSRTATGVEVAQQPSREFASTDPTTGTQDARFQINQIGAALCFCPCSRL
jgi:hypothetical protein